MWLEWVILISVLLYLIYRFCTANHDYFKKRGIPSAKHIPIVGNFWEMVLGRKSMLDVLVEIYNEHDGKVYGVFDQGQPIYMIKDPELIKQIAVKDFDHFVNHRTFTDPDDDKHLFAASLFMMQDGRWKDMRSTLSPAFTGSKMRAMYQLMHDVAQQTMLYMKSLSEAAGPQGLELEIKDFITRYTNDIIASTAFGLQVNSFTETDNEFYISGKKMTTFTFTQGLKFFLFGQFPKIMNLLNIQLFDKQSIDYFMRLVLDSMKYRQEKNIIRPDMINMLMEARGMIKSNDSQVKASNREWSDVDIVGQCFLFFFAGFETSSSLSCFTIHELMENPDIQEKLYEEIQEVNEKLNGQPPTYEAMMDMRYMDMVVRECLRKWPAANIIDRTCNKDISYDLGDGLKLDLKKGDGVWLPVPALHRDPQYFDQPLKFDPERFSEENKDTINPFAYIPFGVGPRNCIGSRFALLESKVLVYYLLREFKFEKSPKSCIPMELKASGFQLSAKHGFWVNFVARS
ncbi:putative cytochrome P450 9f2 [Haematobia irritans]|uniref:putative cytochrome P450 9f2 n=1 Tax=Haematobia irritans TaxID=7368 RepID=UPI003F4F894E